MSCELTSDSQNTKIKISEAIFMFVLHYYGHAKQENIKEKTLFWLYEFLDWLNFPVH